MPVTESAAAANVDTSATGGKCDGWSSSSQACNSTSDGAAVNSNNVDQLGRDHERCVRRSHKRLKLRTDGGQSRVHRLGSIDLFLVTSLKMNQLSPNFEHKLPIMYGILAANFFAIWSAFPVLLWPPVIRLANVDL